MLSLGEVLIIHPGENPKQGELWEILAEIKNNQMWVKVDDNLRAHYEALNLIISREMRIEFVFEVVANYDTKRVWKNVLIDKTYDKYYSIIIRHLAIIGKKYLTLEVRIREVKLQAMVNSKAQGNFISPTVVLKHYLPTKVKNNKYQLVLANSKIAAKGLIKV